MTKSSELTQVKYKELKLHLEKEIIVNSTKLKYNYPPITEKVGDTMNLLKVKDIYQLNKPNTNFYLFKTTNPQKVTKFRYFFAILMASHSSDLLVMLARIIVKGEQSINLIQFSVYPKNFRTGLLSLKEITSVNDLNDTFNLLNEVRTKFRKILNKVKNIVESN